MWDFFPLPIVHSFFLLNETLFVLSYPLIGIELTVSEEMGFIQVTPVTVALVFLSMTVFTLLIIRTHHKIRRHNELLIAKLEYRAENIAIKQQHLQEQHQQTQEKSRQLRASLDYAKHIQNAVLPNEAVLRRFFPTSFAILESKEVVSGDFYWVAEKYDTVYMAVVDCTGHGVPGAFMSLIARSLLHEVIQNKGVMTTNNILEELRSCLIEWFKEKSGPRTSDGMDMALVSYNKHSRVLCYSGANQSLLICRQTEAPLEDIRGNVYAPVDTHDNTRLYHFKADRQPVGEHHGPMKPFTNYTAKLEAGDRIFAFTDGFRDQFGGPNNKRLKSHRFRNLILSSQHLSLEEQRKQLVNSFYNWKGNKDQIDDVCVVGIEI